MRDEEFYKLYHQQYNDEQRKQANNQVLGGEKPERKTRIINGKTIEAD